MANRYLIGSGNRNWNSASSWSATSGGAGGASIPTSADNVILDSNSGTGIITIDAVATMLDFSCTGVGAITLLNAGYSFNIHGSFTLNQNLTINWTSVSSSALYLKATSLKTMTTNGCVANFNKLYFDGVGGTWVNQDNMNLDRTQVFVVEGDWDTNDMTVFLSDRFRYFVTNKASANWNDTSNWSLSSGGVGGAGVPTSMDCAMFDENSLSFPCNLTINAEANCLDLDFSRLNNLLTITNSTYNLNVYGNLTLTSNTYLATDFSDTGYLQLKATTSVNITSNGCTRAWNKLVIDGVGGTFNFVDDWFSTAIFNPQNGTINLGSYSHSFGQVRYNTGVAVLNAQSSTITTQQFWDDGGTSFTFNAGTSTFRITLVNATSFTFYNLEYDPSNSRIEVWNNQTVLNNFICNGTNATTNRLLVSSTVLGTPKTITVNGSIVASNVYFRDITLAGTANRDLSAITGGSGDCGGNSGITFTPAVNQYFKHTGSTDVNWSDTTKWFTTSGGSTAGRVPLPQDDAIFDANSFDANCTLNVNVPRIGGLNMEEVNQNVTFNLANHIECYRSYILGNTITHTGSAALFMFGRGDYLLKLYQKTIYAVVINVIGSNKVTNMSSFSASNAGGGINVISGVFDLNDFDVNLAGGISTQLGSTLYFGSGTAYLNKAVGTNLDIHVGSTIFSEQSLIVLNPTSGSSNLTFAGGGKVFNKIKFSGNHAGRFDVTGNNTIAELIIDAGRNVRLKNGTTQSINKITSNGTPQSPVTIQSTTAGSQATINYTGAELPYVKFTSFKDINATNPIQAMASTDSGNNTNILFNPARFWVGGSGSISDTSHWSSTSGGSGGSSLPDSTTDVFFDKNSMLMDEAVVTFNSPLTVKSLDFHTIPGATVLSNSSYEVNVYGHLTLDSNGYLHNNFTDTSSLNLRTSDSVRIISNGNSYSWNKLIFNGPGGIWTNQDDMGVHLDGIYLANGSWVTSGHTISAGSLNTMSGVKDLSLGNSTVNLSNGLLLHSYAAGLTIDAGTSVLNMGGDWCDGGGKELYDVIWTPSKEITGSFGNFTCNDFVVNEWNSIQNIIPISGNITVNGDLGLYGFNRTDKRLMIKSNILGTKRTITVGGYVNAQNVDFRDINAAGAAYWNLSAIEGGSGDCAGNANIVFTPPITLYFKHVGISPADWSDESKWFTDDERLSNGRVPLPQDSAVFDENTFDSDCTVNINVPRLGGLDMTNVDTNIVLNHSNQFDVYKGFVLGPTVESVSIGSKINSFFGRLDYPISVPLGSLGRVEINAFNGRYYLSGNFTSESLYHEYGLFDANNYDVTTGLYFNSMNTPTLNMSSGLWTINSVNDIGFVVSPDIIINAETSTLKFNALNGSGTVLFYPSDKSFNKVWFSGTHSGYYHIQTPSNINEIIVDAGRNLILESNATHTVAKLSLNGTLNDLALLKSSEDGVQANVDYIGGDSPMLENLALKDINLSLPIYILNGSNLGDNTNALFIWSQAKKTMGFSIRLVKI